MSDGIEMYGPVSGNTEFGPVVNGKKFSLPVPRQRIVEATHRVRDASLGVERRGHRRFRWNCALTKSYASE